LIAAGEWQRRTERQLAFPGVQSANIPSVLTAAGTTVAYATIYAAYALYGFFPPAAAFILLGAAARATLGAALLPVHGRGGLGIIGAYLSSMLVVSKERDFWSLYVYLVVVNAAGFALARVRLWYWLAVAALVLGALWSWPGTDPIYFSFVAALGAHVFFVVAGFSLAATFPVAHLLYGPTARPGRNPPALEFGAFDLSFAPPHPRLGEPPRSSRARAVHRAYSGNSRDRVADRRGDRHRAGSGDSRDRGDGPLGRA